MLRADTASEPGTNVGRYSVVCQVFCRYRATIAGRLATGDGWDGPAMASRSGAFPVRCNACPVAGAPLARRVRLDGVACRSFARRMRWGGGRCGWLPVRSERTGTRRGRRYAVSDRVGGCGAWAAIRTARVVPGADWLVGAAGWVYRSVRTNGTCTVRSPILSGWLGSADAWHGYWAGRVPCRPGRSVPWSYGFDVLPIAGGGERTVCSDATVRTGTQPYVSGLRLSCCVARRYYP